MQTKIIETIGRNTTLAFDKAEIAELAKSVADLARLGVGFSKKFTDAMDAGDALLTPGNVGALEQHLQNWLPGIMHIIVAKRNADRLADQQVSGSFEDEKVILRALEKTGKVGLYSDHGAAPLVSWNPAYQQRGQVRAQIAVETTMLEEAVASRAGFNDSAEKTAAAVLALEIFRNEVFFNGYNDGANAIYGFLNDPNLPTAVVVADGASTDTEWSTKTNAEKAQDLLTGIQALRTGSGQNFDPYTEAFTVAVASSAVDQLEKADASWFSGLTVRGWLLQNYPKATIIPVNELDAAIGGENGLYIYADKIADSGTDGGQVMSQIYSTKVRALNTVPTLKGSITGYANALTGCWVKRGYGVVRYFGI